MVGIRSAMSHASAFPKSVGVESSSADTRQRGVRMSRVKVLVIGTEESEVIDIKNMLGAYEVVVARGTRGAVRILTSDPRISIVLIDRDSIGPDALDIPAFLHENPRLLHVRTIVLAQPDHEDIESSALRAGAD